MMMAPPTSLGFFFFFFFKQTSYLANDSNYPLYKHTHIQKHKQKTYIHKNAQ
jgi:hypothetical protein